ncbi:uncharacterized protein LOC142164261 [Nicotiana tabacum]|uniref:Uncharacterized protein LOC142164261 n=1 Tax=Nicotiana tabacum TaxID=4097 RepID=A0AC58RZ33_TOBAC
MEKTYDRMSWTFISAVMRKFGFSKIWIDIVWNLISNEKVSGQRINTNKSFFVVAPNTKASRINRIRNSTGFMDKNFPFTYLGCPIYVGRKRICYFDDMVAKIVKRLGRWKGKMLSYGGKVVLIKNVIHTLSAMSPPKTTLKLIEKHFARFLWGSVDGKDNYH